MPVDPAAREKFLAWITDQGKNGGHAQAAYTGEQSWLVEGPLRIPFRSPILTWATTGGMPVGHIGRWYGPEGSGKSMTDWGLFYCAQNFPRIMTELAENEIRYYEATRRKLQAGKVKKRLRDAVARFPDGMSICLYDTEQRAQLDIAAQMGVDLSRDKFVLIEENIIEEIAYQMEAAVEAYHVICIDSASNAESYKEANLEPGAYEQGGAAAAWKRLRSVRRKLDRKENTIVIVDQMRMGLGQSAKFQKPRAQPPQIRFLKHNASLAIEFDEGRKLYLNDDFALTDDRDKASDEFRTMGVDWAEVAGIEMRCEVAKNSTGKPFRHGIMRFRFPMADVRTGELVQEVGFDEPFELLKAAEYFHIVESGGGGMFYLLDEDFQRVSRNGKGKATISWKGEWRAALALYEDEELRDRVLARLRIAT
jgi:RecA/RadA recombinase